MNPLAVWPVRGGGRGFIGGDAAEGLRGEYGRKMTCSVLHE